MYDNYKKEIQPSRFRCEHAIFIIRARKDEEKECET